MKSVGWMTRAAVLALALMGACDDDTPTDSGVKPTVDLGPMDVGPMDATIDVGTDLGARDAVAVDADGAVAAALSDGQVVGVVATIDTGEVGQGNLAQTKGVDARVRSYGAEMVTMHTASSARMMTLAQSNGIASAESPLAQMLRSEAATTQARLAGLSGSTFDREYVAAQVTQHARALDVIDSALIPNAMNAALRAALQTDVRPLVAMHLQQARDLQTALGGP